jgi:putative ABC transport system substrate-binding protein
MITRRQISIAGGFGLLAGQRIGLGQSAAAVRRVGFVTFGSEAAAARIREPFKQGMQDLGWLEGKNVEYRSGSANFDPKRLDTLIGDMMAWKVEVIVAASSPTVRAAQQATRTIPIVMAYIGNVVASGFVSSLARPGGNITGITNQLEDVLAKAIEILHEVAPGARRMAILLNESNPSHAVFWSAARRACATLNLTPIRVAASTSAGFSAAVEEIVRQGAQAVAVATDPLFNAESAKLNEVMQPTRLPVAYSLRENAVAGGLLSYGVDIAAAYRYAAKYVDKILKGAKPADLPVEQPTKFELVVNLRTARALGLKIPQTVLLRADEVIE